MDRRESRKRKPAMELSNKSREARRRIVKQGRAGSEPNGKGRKKGRQMKASKRVEVKWTVTEGETDFETVIRNFDQMTPAERLKAKTKFLEKRYGAVAQLDSNSRRFEGIADEDDCLESHAENAYDPVVSHEDAIFGQVKQSRRADATESDGKDTAGQDRRTKDSRPRDSGECLISEAIVQSQRTTSWRERAAWLRQRRKQGEKRGSS